MLDALTHIDEIQLSALVENVVLAEIAVDQLTLLIQNSDVLYALFIQVLILFLGELRVFKSWGCDHIRSDVCHDEDIGLYHDGLRTGDLAFDDPAEVSEFFFSPDLNQFSGVVSGRRPSESELSFDVFFPVFEYENRGFIDFYS
jgi:hypothetical protein